MNWNRQIITDVNPALKRFERWLSEHGYRDACISSYLRPIERFLKEQEAPTHEEANLWRGDLAESKPARSTVSNWGAALKAFFLINLEDANIDMMAMTLRIREGKFGMSAILQFHQ